MSQRWAVICGLIRDEAALATKLALLADWRRQGVIDGVVLSTWIGERERYPLVAAAFEAGAFTLVELEPPLLKAPGHVMHQMKTLHYGLQAVPPDAWVLRLRPDIAPLNDTVRQAMLDPGLDLAETPGWPTVFSSRILIAAGFLDQPFYLNDIIFYGRRADLQKLACFDLSTEYVCANTSPEQFFFRGPFAGRFPLFEAALQVLPHFAYSDEAAAGRRLAALLGSDFFLDVLALNLLFLKTYFRVGIQPASGRRPPDGLTRSLAEVFSAAGRFPGIEFSRGAQAALLQDERAIDAILSGTFQRDDLGTRFAAALARVGEAAYRDGFEANPLTPQPAVRALAQAIWAALPGMPNRLDELDDSAGRRFVIRGSTDRLSLTGGTDEMRQLEEEVNFLRRRVDELNAHRS